jgi:hypothetical protein
LDSLDLKVSKIYPEKNYSWRQIDLVNWQAVAEGLPALPSENKIEPGDCPSGMIRVQGEFLLDSRGKEDSDEIQLAQNEACAHWRTEDHGVNGLCDRFDPERWNPHFARRIGEV